MSGRTTHVILALSMLILISGQTPSILAQVETASAARWYLAPSAGMLLYEGDEEVKDGPVLSLSVGYEYRGSPWALECSVLYAPQLDENTVGWTAIDPDTGLVTRGRRPQAQEPFGETFALGIALQGLCHFRIWERVDPYLTLGVSALYYDKDVTGENFDPSVHAGCGIRYHISESIAVSLDGRVFIAGKDTEANALVSAGLVWALPVSR